MFFDKICMCAAEKNYFLNWRQRQTFQCIIKQRCVYYRYQGLENWTCMICFQLVDTWTVCKLFWPMNSKLSYENSTCMIIWEIQHMKLICSICILTVLNQGINILNVEMFLFSIKLSYLITVSIVKIIWRQWQVNEWLASIGRTILSNNTWSTYRKTYQNASIIIYNLITYWTGYVVASEDLKKQAQHQKDHALTIKISLYKFQFPCGY